MKMDRRDFIKWMLGGAFGFLLVWLGSFRSEEKEGAQEGDDVRESPRPEPRLDPFLCTVHLGHRDVTYQEYWDPPIWKRLEAIARRARERLEEPWEAPVFAHIVRSPHVDVLEGVPCPAIESDLVESPDDKPLLIGVGRGSVLLWRLEQTAWRLRQLQEAMRVEVTL